MTTYEKNPWGGRAQYRPETLKSPTLTVTRVSNKIQPHHAIIGSSVKVYYTDKSNTTIRIQLAGYTQLGTNGENRQEFITQLNNFACLEPKRFKDAKFKFILRDNPHDANAIEVLFKLDGSPRDGWSAGWIPKEYNLQLINHFSNFNPEHRNNIEKIIPVASLIVGPSPSNSSKNGLLRDLATLGMIYLDIPMQYQYDDLFPRPGRLGLITD